MFYSSFYVGLAIDTFAGEDMLKYLNPKDSGTIHQRAIEALISSVGDHMPTVKLRRDVLAPGQTKHEDPRAPGQSGQESTAKNEPAKPGPSAELEDIAREPTTTPDPPIERETGNLVNRKKGDPCDPGKGEDCQNIDWHPKNLWIYGETVHGVRSADVDCGNDKTKNVPVCADNPLVIDNPTEQFYYILRNTSSLEGFRPPQDDPPLRGPEA